MKNNWVKNFYDKQYQWMRDELDQTPIAFINKEVNLLFEQYGKTFSNVLELGAGRGDIANAIASYDKKVTIIELVEMICKDAVKNAHVNVEVMCDDFYIVELDETFDFILYRDGFGVGNDQDQLFLLERIFNWLKSDGYALIDIYQPKYWKKIAGQEMYPFGSKEVSRRYDYDKKNQRMLDTWWETAQPNHTTTQSLACYSPNEIYKLCKEAGLEIVAYYPGGTMDYENMIYHEVASLDECLSYRIKVRKQ